MYLFTRGGRLAPGSIRKATPYIAAVTEKVNQVSGLEIHAWMASMSPELGQVVFATFVEHLEQLEEAQDKLAVDEGFLDLAEQAAGLYVGPLQDGLAQVVHGGPAPGAAPPAYVTVARAIAANGKLGEAMTGGVEIAEAATRITGINTTFLADATGPYGGCRWTSGFDNIAALEQSEAALMADDSWLALIDRVGPAYAQGATQSVYRRVT